MLFLVYFMMSFVFLFPVFEKFWLFLNLPGFTCKFFILAQGQKRALGSASLGFKHHLLGTGVRRIVATLTDTEVSAPVFVCRGRLHSPRWPL